MRRDGGKNFQLYIGRLWNPENNFFVLLGEKVEDVSLVRQEPVEKSLEIQERARVEEDRGHVIVEFSLCCLFFHPTWVRGGTGTFLWF